MACSVMAGDRGWRKERYPLHAMLTRHIRPAGAETAGNLPESARKAPPYRKNPQRSGRHPVLAAADGCQAGHLGVPLHGAPCTQARPCPPSPGEPPPAPPRPPPLQLDLPLAVQPVGQILDLIEHRVGVLGFVTVTNSLPTRLARLVTVTYPGVPAFRRTAMGHHDRSRAQGSRTVRTSISTCGIIASSCSLIAGDRPTH